MQRKIKNTLFLCLAVIAFMVGLVSVSVPLYRWFCQVTGYGGTTQISESVPQKIFEREVEILFTANTHRDMPWEFRPEKNKIVVKVGENRLAFYHAHNPTDKTITGTASFNVVPDKAGVYFSKIDCFCFREQVLAPDQSARLPVSFYIDPEFMEDENMRDVKQITLSYSFFLMAE